MTTIEQIRGQTTEERGTMNKPRNVLSALACTLLVSAIPSGMAYARDDDGDRHHGDKDFKIEVLSSRPYMVSGGDALVRVTVKKTDVNLGSVRIELNGANITGADRKSTRLNSSHITISYAVFCLKKKKKKKNKNII